MRSPLAFGGVDHVLQNSVGPALAAQPIVAIATDGTQGISNPTAHNGRPLPLHIATALTTLLIWFALGLVSQAGSDALTLDASTWARAFKSGEVILVTVEASHPVARLEGTAFGRKITFWSSDAPRRWHGLIGVPLNTRTGSYPVALDARGVDGTSAQHRPPLKITRATFDSRRLRMDPRFVTPPKSAAARIRQERKNMATVFAASRPERLWRGEFQMPVPGAATSSFGRLSILNGRPRGRHQGTDFSGANGTPVHAPNAGRVVLAADHYFSGKTVVVDHGAGLFSMYAHLSRIAPEVGQEVARGDGIGEVGATGRVTGPHLHWAVRLHGSSVDPLSLVAAVAKLPESQ